MKEDKPNILKRLIVLGDSNVGKTTLLKSFVFNKEDRQYAFYNIEFHCQVYEKDNQKIKLFLFDSFGQRSFKFKKNFMIKCNFIVLLYDITNRDSFDSICIQVISQIYKESNPIIILIGNKCDLESKRQVSFKEGLDIANQYGVFFYEVSALKGIRVDEFINDVLNKIIQIS
ncbi:small GTPase family Rab protein (macronuclear) [Tetrahymena thermophila SB210]|uniref:Small GTPase family Rab protein n=2 Tax=Tetrahymena thermophila TaxID=5911 RepID=A4VE74_TETTS|nr:small GTPase family Rab protein [Tetrahymena thermophila SB210]EDK31825.1 small GTPase family Rab protein [Tetrahymena thermophila SB210]BAJ21352.1 Rab-family small GTPase RabX34 [Tetrahymena thermophila]|eukprot:XP_001471282.1 small GTPase family Rab protein [Tetrahymena thermophila SB210]